MPELTEINGLKLFHLNEHETKFLYKELFEDLVYLKHGIQLDSNSIVVDIGANIGMFALFLHAEFPGCRMVMVEPSPALCAIIRANTSAFAGQVSVIQKGISNSHRQAEFTFYPGHSIVSGFKADQAKDGESLRGGLNNKLSRSKMDPVRREEYITSLIEGKLAGPQSFKAELITLEELIAQENLKSVDLLKIDAEGCELEILQGMGEANWPKIRQIVIEVHGANGLKVGDIVELLEAKQLRVIVEQEDGFEGTSIFNVYAFNRQLSWAQ